MPMLDHPLLLHFLPGASLVAPFDSSPSVFGVSCSHFDQQDLLFSFQVEVWPGLMQLGSEPLTL